jgi:hypothetical protein
MNPDLVSYVLAGPPRPLVCYRVTNRNPLTRHEGLIDMLNAELEEYVRSSSAIQPI